MKKRWSLFRSMERDLQVDVSIVDGHRGRHMEEPGRGQVMPPG